MDLASFEAHLETIRQELKIPGMSAAVVRDQKLVWAKGFGHADLENRGAATPDTPYGLASVTKPIAAVLVMQLVEEGAIDLDASISRYGVALENAGPVTVRHLLTHTSEGTPGTAHHYNGNRYALLGGVIEGATGQSFARLLSDRVLLPLSMRNTALNPIDHWGPEVGWDLGSFARCLGLAKAYRHYPDVYARLAKPYQLDASYNLIPGMHRLAHSPAAGLVSSVTDLAAFDIALDQGLLLGDARVAEMHTPAYSTYRDRQDLMYGLGWYVQEYNGLQLLWHTGRWPPSTSALYLKVPQKQLTFIVLANTDNLTTPFGCIGDGDVSKSALALSFFRHYIYPEQLGTPLPEVDWSGTEDALIRQLSGVEDESARHCLERELWSFRQVYASVGRDDQARKLWRVALRAFPQSAMRADPHFTDTAGKPRVVPPAIRAATYHWISLGIALWFATVMVSLVWMLIDLVRTPGLSKGEWAFWLLATLLLGPLSLVAYGLVHPTPGTEPLPAWRQAVGASVYTVTAHSSAWALAISLLKRLGDQSHPLAILGVLYLTPLLVSLALFRAPFWLSPGRAGLGRRMVGGLLTEVILLNVGFAVLFPLTMLIGERVLTAMPGAASPFFWAMLSVIAVVGAAVQFPITYWLIRRGHALWPFGSSESSPTREMPAIRTAWQQLAISMVVVVGSLAVTISQLA